MEDAGKRGPLKRLAFLQEDVNQSSTQARMFPFSPVFPCLGEEQKKPEAGRTLFSFSLSHSSSYAHIYIHTGTHMLTHFLQAPL